MEEKKTACGKMLNRLEAYSEAYNKLTEFYKDSERKKLVNYLLTTFLSERPYYILFSKKEITDSLSGSKLNTVFDRDHLVPKKGELRDLTESFRTAPEEEKKSIKKRVQELLREDCIESKRPRLAVSIDGSRKILGVEEHTALLDWAIDNIKDRTVNGILRFSTWEDRDNNEHRSRDSVDEEIIKILRKRMGIIEDRKDDEKGRDIQV